MTPPRDPTARFRRGLERIERLMDALHALPVESWSTLQARCHTLAGNAPGQIAKRARLLAASMVMDDFVRQSDMLWMRGMGIALRLFGNGIALLGETAVAITGDEPFYMKNAPVPGGHEHVDRYMQAMYDLEQALVTAIGRDHETLWVLKITTHALLRAEYQHRPDFLAVYAWVEPEVPWSQVDASLAG